MRSKTGRDGENYCAARLRDLGWCVSNINDDRVNVPNVDLKIERGSISLLLQIKASAKERGYITGGSVNPKVVSGGAIFNRVAGGLSADFIVFISSLYSNPSCFIVPVIEAEKILRKNIDAYFKSPKLNGGEKRHYGQADIYVGEDPFPHARIVPDQRADVSVYREAWDILVG
jgi:hypothetical protein